MSEGARVLSERAAIVKQAKQAGFLYVSLDLGVSLGLEVMRC